MNLPYDRSTVSTGIVHLGLGAFARAHLAVYVDDLLAHGHHGLGITGVSLRHDDVQRALAPTDCRYPLAIVDGHHRTTRTIGSVLQVLHAPSQGDAVRAALAAPTTTIISVTVTEKGYCWDPATRRLDLAHPDVVHDIAHPTEPRSLPGHLVLAATDRRAAGTAAPTVLSLDNLPSNGRTLATVVLELAAQADPTLAAWIEEHVRFPCSMVDRIVPAITDELRVEVRTEPYSCWVVERHWSSERPPFEQVGVTVVDDVAPWEMLKLRILNGMHTAAAHFGLRHGLETVDRVVVNPAGRRLLERVAAEASAVLEPPDGVDPAAYVATTLGRFRNAALGHRCEQIATDTSQKLPQRLLDTVRLRLAHGLPVDAIAEVLALWAWATVHHPVRDPMASRFAEIARQHGDDPTGLATALVHLRPIFGDLAGNETLTHAVATRLHRVMKR
jgi:fructuronate reductase